MFGELGAPELRFENRSSSGFPDRSAAAFRATFEELTEMVTSVRSWHSAVCWLSQNSSVVRFEREAVGRDGEHYTWSWLVVSETRDGRLALVCQFDIDDEGSAFAYAEQRVRETSRRLVVENRASRVWRAVGQAMREHDADAVAAHFQDSYVYDDQWALGGDAPSDVRGATERVFAQYSQFAGQTLAVRGDSLQLGLSHWSNDDGYETGYLHVTEIDVDGRVCYYGRFDEDDFEGAYRELERRYYADEGSEFAQAGWPNAEWTIALNRGDLDRVFDEYYGPDMRFAIRSRSAFPDRSAAVLRASLEELHSWVTSMRTWHSAMHWLTPTCCVIRNEREATGKDGERYSWTMVYVTEWRGGKPVASCEFELDDEDAAFEYAEERVRAAAGRLAVANLASRAWDRIVQVSNARDIDAMIAAYADPFVYDDRRRLGGLPLDDLAAAAHRILDQYNRFEARTLAVRGEQLHLGWTRWSNDSGFETTNLVVHEVDGNGRFIYEGRFDEDDFERAYRELERRYYSGEGAAFAEAAAISIEYVTALGRGDLDRMFGELTSADFHVENRSRSAFPDRSAAELRASAEELLAMVDSVRTWHSTVCWVSPTICVARDEREAIGRDREQYSWTRLHVGEIRDGRVTSACQFEIDDEAAAFAYAEQRVRDAEGR
jgi:ketosteroid isomerase-like protein